MNSSSPESIADYVADYECLIEGVEFFLNLQQKIAVQGNIEAIRRHYEEHPEDKLSTFTGPGLGTWSSAADPELRRYIEWHFCSTSLRRWTSRGGHLSFFGRTTSRGSF